MKQINEITNLLFTRILCFVLFFRIGHVMAFLWFSFRRPARSMLPPINEQLIINKLSIKNSHFNNNTKWHQMMNAVAMHTHSDPDIYRIGKPRMVRSGWRLILFSTKLRSNLCWCLVFLFLPLRFWEYFHYAVAHQNNTFKSHWTKTNQF